MKFQNIEYNFNISDMFIGDDAQLEFNLIDFGGARAGLGGKTKAQLRSAGRSGRETQARMRETRRQTRQYAML